MERLAEQLEDDLNELISCISQVEQERIDRAIRCLVAYEDTGLTPGEVKAIKDAEEQGLLVKLPCKAGDTVYRTWAVSGRKSVITAHVVDLRAIVDCLPLFGKTVFLAREEAEAALEEENRNDGKAFERIN